jgi:hypothetical protein
MERRKNPRLQLKILAQISADENFSQAIDAEILDISRGGAFVHCLFPIHIGQEIHLRVYFDEIQILRGTVISLNQLKQIVPDVASSRSTSVIRWARGTAMSGFGLEFVFLDDSKRAFVEKVHERLREMDKLSPDAADPIDSADEGR